MLRFDVIVIGCGPGGERAAIYAARAGKTVAVVERHTAVGGTRVNWGTIPSKTLRESALFVKSMTGDRVQGLRCSLEGPLTVADFMAHEKSVVQHELELINRALDRNSIQVFRGTGRFVDPHTVAVIGADEQVRVHLTADVIVLATGSRPNRPADIAFDDQVLFDSHTILRLPRIPRSLLVLGAGVIGVEYTSIFTALGVEVTLQDTRAELLPYVDREVAGLLEKELQRNGAVVLHDDHYETIERLPGEPPRMRCTTRKGNVLEAEALLYAAGRDGNSHRLNLDAIGLTADARGLMTVNDLYQTAHPHIYAVGDLIGYPALASTSMEQGRRAMRHAFGLPGPVGHAPELLPFAIYSIPEVSYIGETEETARTKGLDVVVGRGRYALNPRAQIVGDTTGLLKLLFAAGDLRLLGVHVVGHAASELIHTGQAWLARGATANDIADEIFNYPTLSDLYRHAALEAVAAKARRDGQVPTTSLDEAFYLKS